MREIVTIGGGTGQMAVLTGLKEYADTIDITAVVAMADDGGSTGRLRDELGVLPPGDIRKCLIALSESSSTMRSLFEYRYADGDLAGHSFGNLFLSTLEKITGSMPAAIEEAAKILRVRGSVVPVTCDQTRVHITTGTNKMVVGEKHLDDKHFVQTEGVYETSLTDSPTLHPRAHEALRTAHCIVIGPGDIYGSILPCLHVAGVWEVIRANTSAAKILVVNATNKKGLTEGWNTNDYLTCVEKEVGVGGITHCIANASTAPYALRKKYIDEEGAGVFVNCSTLRPGCIPMYIQLLKKYPTTAVEQFIRHDEHLLAQEIMRIVNALSHT